MHHDKRYQKEEEKIYQDKISHYLTLECHSFCTTESIHHPLYEELCRGWGWKKTGSQ